MSPDFRRSVMRTLGRCLMLVLPILAGCKGQLAGVTVNVAADGSGDCEVFGVRDVICTEGDAKSPAGFQNVTDVRSLDLRVQDTRAKFAAIGDLKIGDITFSSEKKDGATLLTVRIPAHRGAQWFGAFGVSEDTLRIWNHLDEESKKAESRKKTDRRANSFPLDAPKPPNVLFEINLPGKVEGQGFEVAPLGLSPKVTTDHGEKQAQLSIPLAEIHSNKLKEIVWKIRYAAE
jgi:hypothetical protein